MRKGKFFVERYWVGRGFCFSRIIAEDGTELRGYVHYRNRSSHDSRLHREIDYCIRDILKHTTGKTTGSAYVDTTIVLRHIKDWYEECDWKNKPSYRVLIINKWLDEDEYEG